MAARRIMAAFIPVFITHLVSGTFFFCLLKPRNRKKDSET
jgi:heme/copper-type cytochrome/quinol oxidase subunit 2